MFENGTVYRETWFPSCHDGVSLVCVIVNEHACKMIYRCVLYILMRRLLCLSTLFVCFLGFGSCYH